MKIWVLLSSALLLASCKPSTPAAPARPTVDPALLARGEALFNQNCVACHGVRGQGAPQWQQAGPDGKYPAPPLDGSAHAWYHPLASLKDTIHNGTERIGGSMPPWHNKLTESEIETVIVYFQSLWPEEIYQAWADIDRWARTEAEKKR